MLVDLERDACAPQLRAHWLSAPSDFMCFRVVVRAVESWLMADREALASYFGIPLARVPVEPDALPNPKRTLVELAAGSRRVELRSDIVPDPCGGRRTGPGYVYRIAEFVDEHWRPEIAAASSDSLRRCLRALLRLGQAVGVQSWRGFSAENRLQIGLRRADGLDAEPVHKDINDGWGEERGH